MFVCPLCEHSQPQGTECDGCGKQLSASPAVVVAPGLLADLEPTALMGRDADALVTPAPDIERHLALPAAVRVERTADLDPTAFAAVAVATELVPDIEPTRFRSEGPPTSLPAARACRYCGNQQETGALCDRCGMRIPSLRIARTAAPRQLDAHPCPSCGVVGTIDRLCLACGTHLRAMR
jgi:ribosomal protein L32